MYYRANMNLSRLMPDCLKEGMHADFLKERQEVISVH